MDNFEVVRKAIIVTIVILLGGALAGGLFAWYETYQVSRTSSQETASQSAQTPVSELKTIQQVQEKAAQTSAASTTPQELSAIQQAQLKAQQKNSGGSSGAGGSSDITPQQQAQLEAIQQAQLKASQQASGQ
jgi:hypothetical protein